MSSHLTKELSLLLKEIGFDVPCRDWVWYGSVIPNEVRGFNKNYNAIPSRISLPHWEDVKT